MQQFAAHCFSVRLVGFCFGPEQLPIQVLLHPLSTSGLVSSARWILEGLMSTLQLWLTTVLYESMRSNIEREKGTNLGTVSAVFFQDKEELLLYFEQEYKVRALLQSKFRC